MSWIEANSRRVRRDIVASPMYSFSVTRAFLVSYRPLCRTSAGKEAIQRYGLKPYVDGSCRREPDFEAALPTITCLCRGGLFAPRLRVGDRVAYISKQGVYSEGDAHWRLAALLEVRRLFESHVSAAAWFRQEGFSVPRNCMTGETAALPLHLTDGEIPTNLRRHRDRLSSEQIIRLWDNAYAARARAHPTVVVCATLFLNVQTPPKILRRDWLNWLGRVPITRNPPQIEEKLWSLLMQRACESNGSA